MNNDELGFLRLPQVLELIPVSKSTWWAGVRTQKYPAAHKLSPRVTAWRKADIIKLAKKISEVNAAMPKCDDFQTNE